MNWNITILKVLMIFKIDKVLLLFLTSILFLACQNDVAQPLERPCSDDSPFTDFIIQYKKHLEGVIAADKVPGVAVAIVQDSLIYPFGIGVRRHGKKPKIDKHTILRVGSVSKGFAGVLTGILVEKGFLNWEDKVAQIIPEFQLSDSAQTQRINIKHLLSHTTGMPRHAYTNLIEYNKSLDKIIPELDVPKLIAPEDSLYSYQNAIFSVIEKVLEVKTGKPYSALIKEYIFEPFEMYQALVDYKSFSKTKNKSFPHAIINPAGDFRKTRLSNKFFNSLSSGGVVASAHDMGKYMRGLLGTGPYTISETALDSVFHPRISTRGRRYFDKMDIGRHSHYGLGWRIINMEKHNIVHHGGSVNFYRSEIALDRANNIGICFLFNGHAHFATKAVKDFFDFYDEYYENANANLNEVDSLSK